ncbi:hypothetical protein [Sphingomonas hankookensis]|uniref:hypothetical protein n=1 Tax=Sphingomonas hankookensis TaxID=563996 RepID=UPI003D303D3A
MTGWPQIAVTVWLVLSVCASLGAAARPVSGWLVLTPKQQRIAAIGFALAAISEASLLWAGGFFEGFF